MLSYIEKELKKPPQRIVLIYLKKKVRDKLFLTLLIKQEKQAKKPTKTNKKEKKKKMNLCCIEWFQYNLEIWSKRNLAHFESILWAPNDAASEKQVCGPRSVISPSQVTQKECCPCCSWPRQYHVPDKLHSLQYMVGAQNCHFDMYKHFVCCSEN